LLLPQKKSFVVLFKIKSDPRVRSSWLFACASFAGGLKFKSRAGHIYCKRLATASAATQIAVAEIGPVSLYHASV